MDVADITPQIDRLDQDVDELEDALKPLMRDLGEVAAKLPLLDKAKLYVLATYSIESMLFSSLQLSGNDAKSHPVFQELARVRQYYEKIKAIETPTEKSGKSVDTEAAIRFIKAQVVSIGDKAMKDKLAEQLAKERAKAAIQARKQKKTKADG